MTAYQDLVIRDEPFGGLIVQIPAERELKVNKSALSMIKLYLEQGNEHPLDALRIQYPDVPFEVLRHDYARLIHAFQQWRGDEELDDEEALALGDSPPDPLSAPKEVFWEITWNCNLRCHYCYNSSGETKVDELTMEECRRLIGEWGELGVYKAIIGGGEPFTRPDLPDILDQLEAANIIPIVITNATLITDEIARRLSSLKMLRLVVSLDGASAEVNDSVRHGPDGSFDKAASGIDALSRHNIEFSIQTVLSTKNLEHMGDLAQFAKTAGADGWSIKRLLPYGRATNQALTPSLDQLAFAEETLSSIAEAFDENFIDYQGLTPMDYAHAEPYHECPASPPGSISCGPGFINCGLSPDGRILACNYMNDRQWLGSSFRENSFLEMWRNSENLQQFRALTTDRLPSRCQTCSFMGELCNAGCRAAAYLAHSDWLSMDPDCPYSVDEPPPV